MSASISNLAELPIEILEKILLQLPGQDIVKIEAVRWLLHPTRLGVDFSLNDPDQPTIPGLDA